MSRLPLVSFCALVLATVAAFFITQHLKVTTPLLAGYPKPVPPVINPRANDCGGAYRRMQISFYLLHRSDDVDVWVVNPSGEIVATLASGHYMRRGIRNPDGDFSWDGREDNGQFAPDGLYYVKVALLQQGRTVLISSPSGPEAVRVKSRPPAPRVLSVSPRIISPTAATAVTIRYAGNQHRGGTIRIYRTDLPGAPRLVKSFLTPWRGQTAVWDGLIHGQPAPAGVYLVGLEVTDAACDTGHYPAAFPVAPGETPGAGLTVRYLAAQPPISSIPAGRRATVLVDSRTHAYSWSLQRAGSRRPAAKGTSRSYSLSVPVPGAQAGLYELALRSGANATSVPLVVSAPRPAKLLVVLPSVSWWGLDPGDEDGDGVPDTLLNGSSVDLERPLADGLPAGIADEAGLLEYLDSIRRPYDLTTDYSLAQGTGPALAGHRMVILAGDEEWIPPAVAAGLRAYVQDGGHVVSLGIGSLQRRVTLSGPHAVNPTAPSPADALGASPGPVTPSGAQLIAVIRDGLGIFTGTSGLFKGFNSYEPITSVAAPGKVVSAAGVSSTAPSIVAYRLGAGVVVDVGLPGFGSMLRRDVDAQQLTQRLIAVLAR